MPNLPLSPEVAAILGAVGAYGAYMASIGTVRISRGLSKAARRWRNTADDGALALGEPVASDADQPMPFGWSTAWLAVRTRDPLRLMDALAVTGRQRVGWRSGLAAIHELGTADTHVFVSPQVDGWTYVIGHALPHPASDAGSDRAGLLAASLAQQFPDVQYFFTSTALDLFAWERHLNGKLCRRYAAAGHDVLADAGDPGAAEAALGLRPAPILPAGRLAKAGWRPAVIAGGAAEGTASSPGSAQTGSAQTGPGQVASEEMVFAVAAQWSADPTQIGANPAGGPPALGFLARVPATWRKRTAQRNAG